MDGQPGIFNRNNSLRNYLLVAVFSIIYIFFRFYGTIEAIRFFHRGDRVDPASLQVRGEFVETNLGVSPSAGGPVTVRLIAERYLFVPPSVTVPVGPVRLRITSADYAHGFSVAGKKVKVQPGIVTDVLLRFPSPGTYEFHCDEFCGPGHHAMMGVFVAVSPERPEMTGSASSREPAREASNASPEVKLERR